MEPKRKAKGSWGARFFIIVLAIVLGILLFWLLSFIEQDVGKLQRPEHEEVLREFIEEELTDQRFALKESITEFDRKINSLHEQQKNLKRSTSTLQNTIKQLLASQEVSIKEGVDFPKDSRQVLAAAQAAFLDNQTRDLKVNEQISELTLQRQGQQAKLTDLNKEIAPLEEDFQEEWGRRMDLHRWKTAAIKLALLIPIFLIFSLIFMKYRSSAYWPLVWAGFLSSFIKIATVANRYFPEPYFKYIAIVVIIAIVLRLLVYLIRMIIAPKKDLLVKQYQQLYDKCLCPVCTKPIRTGPLRFIGGLRKKMPVQVASSDDLTKAQPYTCPSCGTGLYHQCEKCSNVRHSLLPYCEHCGDETTG
jgi:predicted RNA-binding Zn-ribbon protein involved in translation (DUF1610 family)